MSQSHTFCIFKQNLLLGIKKKMWFTTSVIGQTQTRIIVFGDSLVLYNIYLRLYRKDFYVLIYFLNKSNKKKFSNFQINRSDELPKMICEHCLYKLELFYEFRERAVRTQSLLIEIYKEINTNKVQNTQRSIDLVGMNHSDFMVHQQQLLTEHNQLDLHLEHRANIIVNSEMVLGQHSVDIDTHSLDTLNLQHHDISNHSLEAQEILAEAGSQNTQYSETEIDILPPHNQILKELHEELQSDVADNGALTDDSQEASSEIEIKVMLLVKNVVIALGVSYL